MERKVMISFNVESELDDSAIHTVMQRVLEVGLDNVVFETIADRKEEIIKVSKKKVMIMRKGGEC